MSVLTSGERVDLCRTERGWSQRELAQKVVAKKMTPKVGDPVYEKRLRAAQTQVSAWEKGVYQLSVTSAKILAQIFNVSVEWLLTGKVSAEFQQSTLPLLEPFVFHDDEVRSYYDVKKPYFSKDFLETWLPVNVPDKLKKADLLIKAPNDALQFEGIREGDYVAIHQYEGPQEIAEEFWDEERIEIGSRKIFLVLVWKDGKQLVHLLARTREIFGTHDLMLYFNSSQDPPLAFPRSEGYLPAIIGEVRGWIHFEDL